MDPLVYKKINVRPGKKYFLTSLVNRFQHVNAVLQKVIEKRLGEKVEPFYIFQNMPANHLRPENFCVVNRALIGKDFNKQIIGAEHEDLNIDLGNSESFLKIIEEIGKGQDEIFMIGFTSSFLNLNNPKIIYIGPSSEIASRYDNKLNQFRFFDSLGLKNTNCRAYDNVDDLKKNEAFPFYISLMYSSGGCASKAIFNLSELDAFIEKWGNLCRGGLLVTDYIQNVEFFPNATAIVSGSGKSEHLITTEQILVDNHYIGNIYPCRADKNTKKTIKEMMIKIGKALSADGYRGLFGCDFMVKGSEVFIHDLNPRRQGGYGILHAVLGNSKLIESEVNACLGVGKCPIKERDFKQKYSWGHTKVGCPDGSRMVSEVYDENILKPFRKIGLEFFISFYPKDATVSGTFPGYYVKTGKSYEDVLAMTMKKPRSYIEKIVSPNL